MPFDAMPTSALPIRQAALLYVLPAATCAEAFVAEIAALRALGQRVVPMEAEAWSAAPIAMADILGGRPRAVLRALRLALRQDALGMAEALAMGGRVAAMARRHGCATIHAAAADASATAALLGGTIAGLPVTIATLARDVYVAPRDLALKLCAADAIAAPCREMAEDLRRIAPRARIHAVPPGVDAAWFRPAADIVRVERVLCLTPLVPHAGIGVLMAALARMPPAMRPEVDVVGDGPLRAELEAGAVAVGVGESLRFLGPRGRRWVAEEGPRYLGLVSPGIIAPDGDRDPAPDGVLQAMAMGLPVVASQRAGLREIVEPECGHLVPPGDAAALAAGLRWLALMSEEHRQHLGTAGRDRVLGRFTIAARAEALAAMLGVTGPAR